MSKDAKRPSWFKLFLHQKAIIDSVDDITAGKALKAAFQYFETGETVDMDQTVFIVFSAIKPYIDESFLDFQRSSVAGKKGMESRWGKVDNTLKDPLTPLKTPRPPQAPYNEAEADADTEAEANAEANECRADKPPTRTRFCPPSVGDVKAYCTEKGYNIDPQRFVDYYESNGWMVGRNKMKSWQAAVRTWASKEQEKALPVKEKKPSIAEAFPPIPILGG